jgi:hypothetical protein
VSIHLRTSAKRVTKSRQTLRVYDCRFGRCEAILFSCFLLFFNLTFLQTHELFTSQTESRIAPNRCGEFDLIEKQTNSNAATNRIAMAYCSCRLRCRGWQAYAARRVASNSSPPPSALPLCVCVCVCVCLLSLCRLSHRCRAENVASSCALCLFVLVFSV